MSQNNIKIYELQNIFAQSKEFVSEFLKDVKGIHELFSLQESSNNAFVRNRYLSLLEKVHQLSTYIIDIPNELVHTNLYEFNEKNNRCIDELNLINIYLNTNINFGKKPISSMKQSDT
jgi:hypothetical protein